MTHPVSGMPSHSEIQFRAFQAFDNNHALCRAYPQRWLSAGLKVLSQAAQEIKEAQKTRSPEGVWQHPAWSRLLESISRLSAGRVRGLDAWMEAQTLKQLTTCFQGEGGFLVSRLLQLPGDAARFLLQSVSDLVSGLREDNPHDACASQMEQWCQRWLGLEMRMTQLQPARATVRPQRPIARTTPRPSVFTNPVSSQRSTRSSEPDSSPRTPRV